MGCLLSAAVLRSLSVQSGISQGTSRLAGTDQDLMCSMVSKLEVLSTPTQPIQPETSSTKADAALQTEEVRGLLFLLLLSKAAGVIQKRRLLGYSLAANVVVADHATLGGS